MINWRSAERRANGVFWPAALLTALLALSILPYVRALSLPMIADDYLQVQLGRQYGPVSGWATLVADPLYRCRATSILITWWTEQLFGISAPALNWTSLLLHALNTWLVFAMGAWQRIGWRAAFVAAAFFAVQEGHQEAVIWYSALPELLVFLFVLGCVNFWIRWLRASGHAGAWLYAAALICYVLALFSKESAVIVVPILALITWVETKDWRRLRVVVPFGLLAILYVAGIFLGQNRNQHFQDGTFSLDAPVWIVWRNSFGRLLWIWGAISLAALLALRQLRASWPTLRIALLWTGLTLLPYCFLTYMPRIPSRHTYLASAGLALVVATGFLAFTEQIGRTRKWAPIAAAAVIVLHNCVYLWTYKHAQYEERAHPTEALIRYVKQAPGPVHIHCFPPYNLGLAALAVEIGAGKPASILIPDESPSANVQYLFCLGDRNHRAMTRPAVLAALANR